MNIDFNDFFRLRVDIMKVRDDTYRLKLENVYMNSGTDGIHTSGKEYYMNLEQLKTFRNYINEVTNEVA